MQMQGIPFSQRTCYGGIFDDNSGIIFCPVLHKNICYGYSFVVAASWRGASSEYPQHILMEN